MPRIFCPHCVRVIKLPDYVKQATIRCPGCDRVFVTRSHTLAPRTDAASTSTERTILPPLLTTHHRCQHCDRPLAEPIHRRAATVVCAGCACKTSVYAIDHACPSCACLLESPKQDAGKAATCPACHDRLTVPHDVLEKEPPGYSDDYRLGFTCPVCGNDVVARAADVGAYAVCPHCAAPFDVPQGGRLVGALTVACRDPLHTTKKITCSRCRHRIPIGVAACPVCQTRLARADYW